MSEKYRDGGSNDYHRFHERPQDFLVEVQSLLHRLDEVMAKYHEGLGDLSSQQKRALQSQIAQLMQQLGLNDMSELPELVSQFHLRLTERRQNPIAPNYPSEQEFEANLMTILQQETGPNPFAPPPRYSAEASDVADFGHRNWRDVRGRGNLDTLTYLYELGKMMSDELIYRNRFEGNYDHILVSDNWRIENGTHRALVLKVLGRDYVLDNGLNRWVKVGLEE